MFEYCYGMGAEPMGNAICQLHDPARHFPSTLPVSHTLCSRGKSATAHIACTAIGVVSLCSTHSAAASADEASSAELAVQSWRRQALSASGQMVILQRAWLPSTSRDGVATPTQLATSRTEQTQRSRSQ